MSTIPDISADFQKLTEIDPGYRIPMSPAAEEELTKLVYDEKGDVLSEEQVHLNVLTFQKQIQAKLALHSLHDELSYVHSASDFFQVLEELRDELSHSSSAEDGDSHVTNETVLATKLHVLDKIEQYFSKLQRIYAEYLCGNRLPNFEPLMAAFTKLDHDLSTKSMAPEVKTDGFNDIYGELYHLTNSLRLRAQQAKDGAEAGLGYDTLKPFMIFMRRRMKEFDFVGLMGKIWVT